jgi:hypothetical protein
MAMSKEKRLRYCRKQYSLGVYLVRIRDFSLAVPDARVHFMQKPFSNRDLAIKVREALESNIENA